MSELYQSIFGIFIGILILLFNSQNKYLAIYFLLLYIQGIIHFYLFHSENVFLVSNLLIICYPTLFLLVPVYYIFLRGLQQEYSGIKKSDWIYFLPFFLGLILTIVFLTFPEDQKYFVGMGFMKGNQIVQEKSFLLGPLVKWAYTFRHLFLTVFFGITSFRFFLKLYNDEFKVAKRMRKWLYFFIIISFLIQISVFFFTIVPASLSFRRIGSVFGYLNINVLGLILNLGIFLFPEILYGSLLSKIQKEIPKENKMGSSFDSIELNKFEEKLATYLQDKPYLGLDFSKAKVLNDLNISDKFFTNYFNDYLGVNFNHWKSDLRITECLNLINANYLTNKTIESLAKEVGFQSRNTFSEAFKLKTGCSTSEYLKKIKK